jgi:hypothetical protein
MRRGPLLVSGRVRVGLKWEKLHHEEKDSRKGAKEERKEVRVRSRAKILVILSSSQWRFRQLILPIL